MNYNQKKVGKSIDRYFKLLSSVDRKGMKRLMNWLLASDTGFVNAPASRSPKRHHCYPGGLIEHSLKMHAVLGDLVKKSKLKLDKESIIIIALLHDICKAGTYKLSGIAVPPLPEFKYEKDDTYPIGHGDKSIIVVQGFIKLTMDEIMAIRWHMGPFDPAYLIYQGSIKAAGCARLVAAVFSADYIASQLI